MIINSGIFHNFANLSQDPSASEYFLNSAMEEIFTYLGDYPPGDMPTCLFLYRNAQLRAVASTRETNPNIQSQVITELASTCYLATPEHVFFTLEMTSDTSDAISIVFISETDISIAIYPYEVMAENNIEIKPALEIDNQKIEGLDMDLIGSIQYSLARSREMRSRPELLHLFMETIEERYVNITKISA